MERKPCRGQPRKIANANAAGYFGACFTQLWLSPGHVDVIGRIENPILVSTHSVSASQEAMQHNHKCTAQHDTVCVLNQVSSNPWMQGLF